MKAYPAKDSIRIRDTIWLELSSQTKLKNLLRGDSIDFKGAVNLGTAINYLELTGGSMLDPGVRFAANDFEHILKIGTLSQIERPDKIRAYRFIEENGMYRFKLGIIPKKTGLFCFAPGDATTLHSSLHLLKFFKNLFQLHLQSFLVSE